MFKVRIMLGVLIATLLMMSNNNLDRLCPFSSCDVKAEDSTSFRPSATAGSADLIAFSSDRGGSEDIEDIYVMNSDGSNQTRLTFGLNASDPSFSPDGSRIAFTCSLNESLDICLMDSDGSNLTNLTNTPGGYLEFEPDWSPDGQWIVFTHGFQEGISVIRVDGTSRQELYTVGVALYVGTPAWSPDGSKIAFEEWGEIKVMDSYGSNVMQLTSGSCPEWSPDGDKLVFGCGGICTMNPDGSAQTQLTDTAGTCPAWSPDGTRIAFASSQDGDWEIYVMNADGSNQVQLTSNSAADWHPSWGTRSSAVVAEARLDIGMPYDTNRGCPSPYVGCGGPYHGFHKGVCTDLAIDAYQHGASFNLGAAVQADYQTNPHGYWYGSARNAHDMYTYFEHTGQLLPHTQAYAPGDIAFFRWVSGNWHVGVISQIGTASRPTAMVHAPGCQLSCTALEQGWNSYYSTWSQGHGRLSTLGATAQLADAPLQTLVLSVDASATMRLYDSQGNVTSDEFDEDLVASNIEAYIPYIPGGQHKVVGSNTFITVTQPLSNTAGYFVQLTGVNAGDYHLRIQTLQNGGITASETFTQAITLGETHGISLTLNAPGGVITFNASPPIVAPLMAVIPGDVDLAGLVGTTATITVSVTEAGGQQPLSEVSVSISDIENQMGQEVTGALFTVTPANFELPAGGSQSVRLEIDLASIQPGYYQGGLIVASANGGSQSIPLSLTVEPFRVFLPLALRDTQ